MKDDDGVGPIGIGEVMRRIMGKALGRVIKSDIKEAGGVLQTCTGVESGLEASIHAMPRMYESEETDAVLLVDADRRLLDKVKKLKYLL